MAVTVQTIVVTCDTDAEYDRLLPRFTAWKAKLNSDDVTVTSEKEKRDQRKITVTVTSVDILVT